MAVRLEAIRTAANRVAASHGLDVVEIEFIGPARERILRVYLEKNAEGRAKLKAAQSSWVTPESCSTLRLPARVS